MNQEVVSSVTVNFEERVKGALMGCVVGDALGGLRKGLGATEPVFDNNFSYYRVKNSDGDEFTTYAGNWGAPASRMFMAAEGMENLIAGNQTAYLWNFCRWASRGRWTAQEQPVDVDDDARNVVRAFNQMKREEVEVPACIEYPNPASLAEVIPVALAYRAELSKVIAGAERVARISTPHPQTIQAAKLLAGVLAACSFGSKEAAVDRELWRDWVGGDADFIKLQGVPLWNSKRSPKNATEVVQAAVWAFEGGKDFEEVVGRAAALGGESAMTTALAGACAGALWGVDSIPTRFRKNYQAGVQVNCALERILVAKLNFENELADKHEEAGLVM